LAHEQAAAASSAASCARSVKLPHDLLNQRPRKSKSDARFRPAAVQCSFCDGFVKHDAHNIQVAKKFTLNARL
jgi:hypothetical protein